MSPAAVLVLETAIAVLQIGALALLGYGGLLALGILGHPRPQPVPPTAGKLAS